MNIFFKNKQQNNSNDIREELYHPKLNSYKQFPHLLRGMANLLLFELILEQQLILHPAELWLDKVYELCLPNIKRNKIFSIEKQSRRHANKEHTFLDNPSGNRASTSPLERRIASRVLATYVGTVRPLLTFSSLGSEPVSEPMYNDKMSGSPVSAKYNRKPSAPTAVNSKEKQEKNIQNLYSNW